MTKVVVLLKESLWYSAFEMYLTQSLRIGNLFKEMGKIFKTTTLFKLLCLLQ